MSYTIEYNKQVFYIKQGQEKIYFLFIRQGDNNVRDAVTNLRSKSWTFIVSGTEKELWKKIGSRLGSINGGGLQKAKGWEETEYFTEEEYIKQYRSKIKNAKPLEEMLDKFSIEGYIYVRNEFENQKDKENELILKEFIEKYDMKPCGTYYYDKTKIEHRHTIRDFETLKDFLLNLPIQWREDYQTGLHIEKEAKKTRHWSIA